MGKPFSRPIQPGAKQGSKTETSRGVFAGGTRGQRAVQVKPLEHRSMTNSNSTDVYWFARNFVVRRRETNRPRQVSFSVMI
jgi:hypothetical protein